MNITREEAASVAKAVASVELGMQLERYVEVHPPTADAAFTIELKVGVQSFRIDGDFESDDEAQWMRRMMGMALARIVMENQL